jgi:hypothetical protein
MAAVPRIWLTVTTPVPPIPIMCRAKPSRGTRSTGSGSSASSGVRRSLLLRGLADGLDGEEGRAVAEQARVVLVARGLVNLGLPAELRLHRLHGQAVRLLPAIAAALAHALVDEHARLGIGLPATLAQRRFSAAHCWSWMSAVTRARREHRLRLEETVAVPDLAVAGDGDTLVVLGVIGGDDDPLHPVRFEARVRAGTGRAPTASWPPVMATAEL